MVEYFVVGAVTGVGTDFFLLLALLLFGTRLHAGSACA